MTRRTLVAVVFTCAFAGCLGLNKKPSPPVRFALEPKLNVSATENSGKSLGVRPLEPARPYKQNVVYRQGTELGSFTTYEWAELPSDSATRALIDALNASHHFTDVANAINVSKPDMVLTGELRKFDLLKDTEPWSAVCEIRLELRKGLERSLVWSKTSSATEALSESKVSDLPSAMNAALAKVIQEAVTEIVTK